MPTFLKEVPPWFLIFCTLGFITAITFILNKLNNTLNRFENLFDRAFEKFEEHEGRISSLEGAHNERTKKYERC